MPATAKAVEKLLKAVDKAEEALQGSEVYGRSKQRNLQKSLQSALRKLEKATGFRASKMNPSEADTAQSLAEAFHGRPEEELIEIRRTVVEHEHLATAGVLLKIELTNGNDIIFDTDGDELTYLALNPEGSQMYIEGGDQSIDLDDFDVDATKDSIILGKVRRVYYSTDKQHLGKADRTAGPYKHKLGEESGDMPHLLYDRLNEALTFAGGSYYVPIDLDGNSSGIHD